MQNIKINAPPHKIINGNDAESFVSKNPFFKNKKLISISPGGYKGFYILGICKYIKQNYILDDYIFSGASAGSWNSLLLCFKRDIQEIEDKLLDLSIMNTKSICELENKFKQKLLASYVTDDFDLQKLCIGVTTIVQYKPNTIIYYGFDDLEDAIDCCIASSHIPFVTGGVIHTYRNLISFDGGFGKYPYAKIIKPTIHITPNIWQKYKKYPLGSSKFRVSDYTTLFSKHKFNFPEMIKDGYKDALKNIDMLNNIFLNK